VTRGWLPQRAGSPCPNGGGTAAAVPETTARLCCLIQLQIHKMTRTSCLIAYENITTQGIYKAAVIQMKLVKINFNTTRK